MRCACSIRKNNYFSIRKFWVLKRTKSNTEKPKNIWVTNGATLFIYSFIL